MRRAVTVLVYSISLLFVVLFTSFHTVSAAIIPEEVANINGTIIDQAFGVQIAEAGDLNNDDIPDFVVSRNNDSVALLAGRVFVFLGGSGFTDINDTQADLIITAEAAGDYFGLTTLVQVDINEDGYDDLAIGAYFADGAAGRVYIFLGEAGFGGHQTVSATTADIIITGQAVDLLGYGLGSGDINGDTHPELFIGGPGSGGSFKGTTYIFYNSTLTVGAHTSAEADLVIAGENNGDNFGGHTIAGDINNDGFDDLVVAANQYSSVRGRTYIFLGSSSPSWALASNANTKITGVDAADYLYQSSCDDFNNDGYDDLIIGASGEDSGGNMSGSAYLFYGSASGITSGSASTANLIIVGEGADDVFGLGTPSLSKDINNDGYNDLIIGAWVAPLNSALGRAYIFFGGASKTGTIDASTAEIIITGADAVGEFGYATNYPGDINDDGWEEFAIGAPGSFLGDQYGDAFIYNLSYANPVITLADIPALTVDYTSATGTASETGINVSGVEYSLDNGAWQACTAVDGAFNSANEEYECDLTGLVEGAHTIRIRSFDTNNVYTPTRLFGYDTFAYQEQLPDTGTATLFGTLAGLCLFATLRLTKRPHN